MSTLEPDDSGIDPVGLTSRLTAAMRAAESARADRLFSDPHASALAGEAGHALAEAFTANQTIAVRTRYFDDAVTEVLSSGTHQLVLCAAGMDTRAFRLDLAPATTVFELDRAAVLAWKDRHIAADPRVARHAVPVDLADEWAPALLDAGFVPDQPACWLAEGLTQYLAESEVHGLLDRISALAAPGSTLLLDVVGAGLLTDPALAPMLDWFAERDMTWRFGTDDPESLLADRGWRPSITPISGVRSRFGRDQGATGMSGDGYFVRAVREG